MNRSWRQRSRLSESIWYFLETYPQTSFLIAAAVLVVGLYWRSLNSPFVYDDLDQIVNNPNLNDWSHFVHRFLLRPVDLTSSLLSNAGSAYRPVFWTSLFLDRQLWGLEPFGYHLTNLSLHLANGWLSFLLLRRLQLATKAAFAAGLIWLILPVNTEVVAWASGRAYILCTLFILAALLSTLAFVRHGRAALAAATFLTSACAAGSHELGVVLLPMLLLLGLVLESKERRGLLTPVFACFAALLLVETWRVHIGVNTLASLPTPRWALLALSQYLEWVALPVHMSVERSTSMTLGHLSSSSVVILGGFVLGLLSTFWYRRNHPWPFAGLIWFLLCLAPFCLLKNYQGAAERFAYLAGLGMVVSLASLCFQSVRPGVHKAMLALVGLWCVWNTCRTSIRVGDWTDPVRLYEASLKATPQSPLLHYDLAFSFLQRGNLPAALLEYGHTLELDPLFPHAYASLGDVYLKLNRYPEAQAAYTRALATHPDDTAVLLNSGVAYANAGDPFRAEQTYRRSLQFDPKSSAPHVNLGVLYLGEGRTNEAMHQFAMAIDLKSGDTVPYYDLGALFQRAGRPDLALVLYKKVLEIKPDDADTLRNIQLIQAASPLTR